MNVTYDDGIRYLDRAIRAHHEAVADLKRRNVPVSGWGPPAMRHGTRLKGWQGAQRAGVHRLAIGRADGAACTCGLVVPADPRATDTWIPFFSRLGHLDSRTDSVVARFVVDGGPFRLWLWCAFCGPVEQIRRDLYGGLDEEHRDELLVDHLDRRCPVG